MAGLIIQNNNSNNRATKQYRSIPVDREEILVAAVKEIKGALHERQHGRITYLIKELHYSEVAWILDNLKNLEQRSVISIISDLIEAPLVLEVNQDTRVNIVEMLGNLKISSIIDQMSNEDAIDFLECFSAEIQIKLLKNISLDHRKKVKTALKYPPKSVGRIMTDNYVVVTEDYSVGKAMRNLKKALIDNDGQIYDIFVVDTNGSIIGIAPVSNLIKCKATDNILKAYTDEFITINSTDSKGDVAIMFNSYDLNSAPVINETGTLIGAVTIDSIKYILAKQSEDELLKMGGVLSDLDESMFDTTKTRFVWLFINLLTAALSSWVISFFERDISAITALAVLMPITVSMGCNGGTQTITVIVRAIATRSLNAGNAILYFWREMIISSANSFLFCIICSLVVYMIYGRLDLALIFGAAIVIAMLVGAFIGVITPVIMKKLHIDPAVASVVFLTTITDIAAFISFLGFARMFITNG